MKKLLIAMMSVASLAFISKAETFTGTTGTSFESLEIGAELSVGRDDAGTTAGKKLWSSTAESVGVVTNANLESYTATCGKPAIATATDEKALMVEAESRLVRSIDVTEDTNASISYDIGSGIYFDTMVQFTATDTAPTPTAGDKLVVWLYGSGDENGAFGIGTNLVVTAGYLEAGDIPVASNYIVSVEGVTVEPNSWHRLTIKAIEKVADSVSAPCGFVVFIDGKEATNASAKWDSESCLKTPGAVAGVWADKNALFPSLVDYSSRQLTSVSLEGTGMIDDITFTSTAPSFARDGNLFTLNWGAGLTALTLNGEAVADFTAGEEGSTVILVAAAGTTYTLVATPDSVNGWAVADVSATNGVSYSEGTFTVNGIGSATITTKQACYTVNGTGAYETFADALEEAVKSDTATIALTADVAECISLDAEGKSIVLDLAGHDIAAVSEEHENPAIIVSAGTMTIIDSVGGGAISSDFEDGIIMQDGAGVIIYGAATNDKGAQFDGYCDGGTVVRGYFDNATNGSNGKFSELRVAEGTTVTLDAAKKYLVAVPGEPEQDDPVIVVPEGGTVEEVIAAATSETGIPLANVTEASQVTIDNTAHTIKVGSASAVTIDAFYTAALAEDMNSITLTLNEAALETAGAYVEVAVDDNDLGLKVSASNTKLYYGLSSSTTVGAATYTAPTTLTQGTGTAMTLKAEKVGNACFYKLTVTDVAPKAE